MKQNRDDRMPMAEGAPKEGGCSECLANTQGAGGPWPCFEKPALRRCTFPAKGEGHSVPAGNYIYNELSPVFSV